VCVFVCVATFYLLLFGFIIVLVVVAQTMTTYFCAQPMFT